MEAKRVTIKDVALAIGVTPQTVSRVFRGSGYVSADTRMRVLDAAEKLKYVPNTAAIRLRTGVTKSIAVVFDSLINIYFSIMVEYLQRELQKNSYEIQTIFAHSHTINESVYREALSNGVSAVISFLEPEPSLGEVVDDYGVPVMILGRRTELEAIDYMTTDDVLGGELVAKKLIAAGCKKFVYLGYGFGMSCVKDRLEGFSRELAANGYPTGVIDCSGGLRQVLEGYIAKNGVPDGMFCFSDMLAYEVMSQLRIMGYHDIKIIGYDDIQADIPMPIDLTTVGVDKPDYVKLVVDALLAKVEKHSAGRIAQTVSVSLRDGETA